MTVIDTSTASTATAYSNQRKIDRCQNGVLWSMFWNGNSSTTDSFEFWYSQDDGATWTDGASSFGFAGTDATYTPNASFFIDLDDYAHVVYKDRSVGNVYYRRGTPNAGRTSWTWSSESQVVGFNVSNDYPDIVVHREGTGWVAHVVGSYKQATSPYNYAMYNNVNISSGGTLTWGTKVNIGGGYSQQIHTWPSIDFNHTGDGKTVSSQRLSYSDQSFETAATFTWTSFEASTIARSTDANRTGDYGLNVTAAGGGNAWFGTPRSQSGYSASPGENWDASCYVRPNQAARRVRMFLTFFDSGGTALGDFIGSWTDTTVGEWVSVGVTATAPASSYAVSVQVQVENSAINETYDIDDVSATSTPVPHLYVAWSAGAAGAGLGIRFRKSVYSGGSWTWNTEREIDSTRWVGSGTWINCLFDGTRVIIAGLLYDGSLNDQVLYERDAADIETTTRVLYEAGATTGLGEAFGGSATYDSNGNVYIFGRTNNIDSSNDLYLYKWIREGESKVVTKLSDMATDTPYASAKRGSSGGVEFIYLDGSSSPYTINYGAVSAEPAQGWHSEFGDITNAGAATTKTISTWAADDATYQYAIATSGGGSIGLYSPLRSLNPFEWWNGSAWVSMTETFVTSSSEQVALSGTDFNSATYKWTVSTKDQFSKTGPYATEETFVLNTPPTVTATSPADGAYVHLIGTPTFDASYSDPDGDPIGDIAIRRQDLAGNIEWWDGASTWVSTETFFTASLPYTFPAASFGDPSYRWSITAKDSFGDAAPYSAWRSVHNTKRFVRKGGVWVGAPSGTLP